MVHTVGHSTRTFDELAGILKDAGVRVLVDVRRHPFSRRHPQFSRDALAAGLQSSGIRYVHEPDLGGHREPRADSRNTAWRNPAFRGYADHMATPEFAQALDRVAALSEAAVMCAEALPARCHRQLLADALACRGVQVRHLLGGGRSEEHRLHPRARCHEGTVVYPAPGQLELGAS